MKQRCPISFQLSTKRYSSSGMKQLSNRLKQLQDFDYTAEAQRQLAAQLASKLSIQGIQPKLSVRLNVTQERFEVVECHGTYIIKPPHFLYPELPENEALTMRMASIFGIETPTHGLIYNQDQSLSYFIQRFDRQVKRQKRHTEDFSQLLGKSRHTKYDSSVEQLIQVIDQFCTFPVIEKEKLFQRILFSFVVGNEDMHLKNYSLITDRGVVCLSPAYDLLNTSIVTNSKEESALPLRGKKKNLSSGLLLKYLAQERLSLPHSLIEKHLQTLQQCQEQWYQMIHQSFLSHSLQQKYHQLLLTRVQRLSF